MKRNISAILLLFLSFILGSCSDFLDVGPPRTDLSKETVFASDETAVAALLDLYSEMQRNGFASGNTNSISFITALSSDEMINFNTGLGSGEALVQFNENTLLPNNTILTNMWSQLYRSIYKANAVIEGANASTQMTQAIRSQVVGEAKFIRAFCHFYLVNFWGAIPLVLTTDYRTNQSIGRAPASDVYAQIITDLLDAQSLLREDYSASNEERSRPNKFAAMGLLARAYLFIGDWSMAEAEASKVIASTENYALAQDLNEVFNKNGTESILQFSSQYPANEAFTFRLTLTSRSAALRTEIVNAFEDNDNRRLSWVGSVSDGSQTFYFPTKYKGIDYDNVTEYSTILRLSEQYLIRAEARANQDNITGAQNDLNAIRNRAGLPDTGADEKSELLTAIRHERLVELFSEWGHRFMDLKRSGTIDQTLAPLKPTWSPHAALFPIPETQLLNDIQMKDAQNPGY